MGDGLKIAVVGATGAVGRELFSILKERSYPIRELIPFASSRSVGKTLQYNGQSVVCRELKPGCFQGVDLAFFDASDAVSKEWVPHAAEAGAWVIDNSATFRMDPNVPLVVPEVNGDLLKSRFRDGFKVIAGPNCSTVQLVLPLKVLRDRWGLKRVVVSSYQSVSGAGTAAMEELCVQTGAALNESFSAPKSFAHQIAFNCIPQIGGFKADGYTSEEQKIMTESRKILGLSELRITATAVRVPTLSCHGESVSVECERAVTPEEARAALASQEGIVLQDTPERNIYPMGMPGEKSEVEGASGRDAVYVGRVRADGSVENGLNFWVVSDNLRKGAALNAVQIGEFLLRNVQAWR